MEINLLKAKQNHVLPQYKRRKEGDHCKMLLCGMKPLYPSKNKSSTIWVRKQYGFSLDA